ncbi:Carboxylesterase type B [Penicillium psychrosexuale]|uniref:Carboxylesterase type B n=1 Tax=Penicillium psychrosexuale TaxID=1002107 RepID=UPI002545BB4F|nr:Carboxylesterase type B [Penicillium psychrosexuale]KAJ5791934.1 Carboxylesterase type B [Penicillium psychrosexuale]
MSSSKADKRVLEEVAKPVVKSPIKTMDVREWNRIQEEEEEAKRIKRIKRIKRENGEIPWWVEDEEDSVKPALTFEEQQKCIEELKDALEICWTNIRSLRNDRQFLNGCYECWPELPLSQWELELNHQTIQCESWAAYYCNKTRRSRCESLSQEQKKDVIESLKGWVVQDDFDRTVSRLPPNIRYNILRVFASMIIIKDCMRLFWSNPFWYLDADGEFLNSEGIEAPFGTHLHTMYKKFLKAEPQLAHHWRAQTIRLANVRYSTMLMKRDPTFGLANEALMKAKAYQFAAAKLEDKTFRCLLKHEDEDKMKKSLGNVYFQMAKAARDLATSQPLLEWRLLDEIPTEFQLSSKVLEAARIQLLFERESRLNGHEVLAIIQPYFFRTGAWNREGGTPEVRIGKAHVLVEDLVGRAGLAHSSDEDAFPTHSSDEDMVPTRRKKRQPKKAKIEKTVKGRTKKPVPKGKPKKGAKENI